MLFAPDINPVAVSIGPFFGFGPLKVHWYGLMYLFGFGGAWWFASYRAGRSGSGWNNQQISDLIFYGALGVILGGRIGSILFYNFSYYAANLVEIFFIWRGGMSFHGGLIGVLVALWLYARHNQRSFLAVGDVVAVLTPIGLFFGRIGNFINQELWGKAADVPWAMVFKTGGPIPRHPSQLYEAMLEGLVLFVVLLLFSLKPRPVGATSGLFLLGYGLFRFAVEFVREPDAHIGYLAFNWLTQGQLLSLPMILFGGGLIGWVYKARPPTPSGPAQTSNNK